MKCWVSIVFGGFCMVVSIFVVLFLILRSGWKVMWRVMVFGFLVFIGVE